MTGTVRLVQNISDDGDFAYYLVQEWVDGRVVSMRAECGPLTPPEYHI